MMYSNRFVSWLGVGKLVVTVACLSSLVSATDTTVDQLLARSSKRVSAFVEQSYEVKCTEQVSQEKLGENEKVVRKAESTFDYLVILSNASGELTLDESRLAVQDAKQSKKHEKKEKEKDQTTPLLVSNGFATLFLIFHPYYAGSFQFSAAGDEIINGKKFSKVHFQHIRNTRSVTALAVRGREYPLELAGMAWIDPDTGAIAKITAGLENGTMDDVRSEEHTSELQSRGHLVCRLLLEKKKASI